MGNAPHGSASVVGEPYLDFELMPVLRGNDSSSGGGGTKPTTLRTVISNGLPTLVGFYASWCPSCVACATRLAEAAVDYAGRANVLLVTIEGEGTPAAAFAEKHRLYHIEGGGGGGGGDGGRSSSSGRNPLQHFWIPPAAGGAHSGAPPEPYGVRYVPHRLLISKAGVVVKNYDVEWEDLDDEL